MGGAPAARSLVWGRAVRVIPPDRADRDGRGAASGGQGRIARGGCGGLRRAHTGRTGGRVKEGCATRPGVAAM